MTEEDAFNSAIDANPKDGLARLVFADWLDERGRHGEAAWYRLEGETGCRPTVGQSAVGEAEIEAETAYPGYWCRAGRIADLREVTGVVSGPEHIAFSRIPEKLFQTIELHNGPINRQVWRVRSTRREIESDAALAFAGLTEVERAEVARDIRSCPR